MGQHRSLRVPRRTRGISDAGKIACLSLRRLFKQKRSGVYGRCPTECVQGDDIFPSSGAGPIRIQHDYLAQSTRLARRENSTELKLAAHEDKGRGGIAEIVRDFFGRRSEIDADHDAAGTHRRHIRYQPLLGHISHDGDAVAAIEPRLLQSARQVGDPLRVIFPGHGRPLAVTFLLERHRV
jgi:hypothetical protein